MDRIKSCFFGVACSDKVYAESVGKTNGSVNNFVNDDFLKFSTSIIKEGGFAPDVCLDSSMNETSTNSKPGYNILNAYKKILSQ